MRLRKCCVPSCSTSSVDGSMLHKFPNPATNPEKFRLWVTNAGLVEEDDDNIFGNRRICHLHFDQVYYYSRNRLSKLAVPTLHLTGPAPHDLSHTAQPTEGLDEGRARGQGSTDAEMKSAKRMGKTPLQCCVTGCNVRTRYHTILHRFPKSKERPGLYKAWLKAVGGGAERSEGAWEDKHVCSRHFDQRHFRGGDLATDAVPTLCLTGAENAAYVEKRVSDELTSYLHRKTVLQGMTPVDPNADEIRVSALSSLPIRDLIIPAGPRVKKVGRHSDYGCSVKGCYTTKVPDVTFFPFPDSKLRQEQWLKSIILSERRPISELRVCSRHFAPGSFKDVYLGLLKTTAVPTLHTGQKSTPKMSPAPEPQIQQVCCTCLASDVKIYKLNDEQKQQYVELLGVKSTQKEVKTERELTESVCYECVAALAKLFEFRERARVARSTLLSCVDLGQSIKELDRSSLGLTSRLSWCNLDGYSIEPEPIQSGDTVSERTEDPIGLDMEVEENDSCEDIAKSADANVKLKSKDTSRYKCDVCLKRFKQKSALIQHVTAHSLDNDWGWEKHVCDMCFRSFLHSRDLLNHVARHHMRTRFHYTEITEHTERKRRNVFIGNRSVTKASRIDCNEEFSKKQYTQKLLAPSKAKAKRLLILRGKRARELLKSKRAKRRELVKEGNFERIDVLEIDKEPKVKEEPFLDMEVLDENLLKTDL